MEIINSKLYVWVTTHWYYYYIKNPHNNYKIYDLFIIYYLLFIYLLIIYLFIDYLFIIYYLLFIYLLFTIY